MAKRGGTLADTGREVADTGTDMADTGRDMADNGGGYFKIPLLVEEGMPELGSGDIPAGVVRHMRTSSMNSPPCGGGDNLHRLRPTANWGWCLPVLRKAGVVVTSTAFQQEFKIVIS